MSPFLLCYLAQEPCLKNETSHWEETLKELNDPPAKREGLFLLAPQRGKIMSPLKGAQPSPCRGGVYPLPLVLDGRGPAGLALRSIAGRWRADKPRPYVARLTGRDKPRPYNSDRYINVGAHEIVSKTTNATVSHGQTFRGPTR